jgi:hypothetical protein
MGMILSFIILSLVLYTCNIKKMRGAGTKRQRADAAGRLLESFSVEIGRVALNFP